MRWASAEFQAPLRGGLQVLAKTQPGTVVCAIGGGAATLPRGENLRIDTPERDARSSLRNLLRLDRPGKAAQRSTLPHPALELGRGLASRRFWNDRPNRRDQVCRRPPLLMVRLEEEAKNLKSPPGPAAGGVIDFDLNQASRPQATPIYQDDAHHKLMLPNGHE